VPFFFNVFFCNFPIGSSTKKKREWLRVGRFGWSSRQIEVLRLLSFFIITSRGGSCKEKGFNGKQFDWRGVMSATT
jgi:hypothetical protein